MVVELMTPGIRIFSSGSVTSLNTAHSCACLGFAASKSSACGKRTLTAGARAPVMGPSLTWGRSTFWPSIRRSISDLLTEVGGESDAATPGLRRVHQLADGREDGLDSV